MKEKGNFAFAGGRKFVGFLLVTILAFASLAFGFVEPDWAFKLVTASYGVFAGANAVQKIGKK